MIADLELPENELIIFFVSDASEATERLHRSILLCIKAEMMFSKENQILAQSTCKL